MVKPYLWENTDIQDEEERVEFFVYDMTILDPPTHAHTPARTLHASLHLSQSAGLLGQALAWGR